MSEYQYYEFLAIDRPLTPEEMSILRRLSTRAHITPVSFVNEYQWGNFKGNPDRLMASFFDAHVYVANWMTAVFKLRLPLDVISDELAEAMPMEYGLEIETYGDHRVLTWSLEESEDYHRFGSDDGRGWMALLTPVRDELLRGDIRSLYIGWLAAVTRGWFQDDDEEPRPVPGLGDLTPAQKSLAEFLEVDPDLLAAAGIGSPAYEEEASLTGQMDEWLAGLPRDELEAFLKRILSGQGREAERAVKNRFAAWKRDLAKEEAGAPMRTVGDLWELAEQGEKKRLEQEKREQERLARQRHKKRLIYLENLAQALPEAWESVRLTVERGSGLAYDEACRALKDLAEAYGLHSTRKSFDQALEKFMAGHMRRKALIQRLVKAGLWKER